MTAAATPRVLPFSYPNETLPEGAAEVEAITDVNPQRVGADPSDARAGNLWEPELRLQTELEYGLTDRIELGFYQVFKSEPQPGGESAFAFDGLEMAAADAIGRARAMAHRHRLLLRTGDDARRVGARRKAKSSTPIRQALGTE